MSVEKLSSIIPARSIKDGTRWPLLSIMLGNIAAFCLAVETGSLVMGGIVQLAQGWRGLIPGFGSFVFASVFNELLDSTNKARLVFWRWHDSLPGTQAFTTYAASDPRVDVAALTRKYRPLPTEAHAQNALWYRLYKTVADHPAIMQVHRKYLFTRDYAVGSFLLLVTLGPAGFWAIPSRETAMLYAGLLLLQYLAARQAAKNHGIRFVTTVLAIKAAE